jgi:hypothetical protein
MWALIKKIGWRIAGVYFWIHFFAWLIGFSAEISSFESSFLQYVANASSFVGASPVNSKFLPLIIKTGWILFFTEFKASLLVGFVLYIVFFPAISIILALSAIFGWDTTSKSADTSEDKNLTLKEEKSDTKYLPFPLLPANVFLVFAWLLIFGDAISAFVIWIGIILASILLLTLLSRLFYSVRPTLDEVPLIFSWVDFPRKFVEEGEFFKDLDTTKLNLKEQIEKKLNSTKNDQKILLWMREKLRHKTVKNFFYLLVLFEFITSLFITGTCAIFCWALIFKIIDPKNLDLFTCLHLSLTYFLLGLDKPALPAFVIIPLWITIGASITSLILLVLYVSLASNSINKKQEAYLQKLNLSRNSYKNLLTKVISHEKSLNYMLSIYPKLMKNVLKDL